MLGSERREFVAAGLARAKALASRAYHPQRAGTPTLLIRLKPGISIVGLRRRLLTAEELEHGAQAEVAFSIGSRYCSALPPPGTVVHDPSDRIMEGHTLLDSSGLPQVFDGLCTITWRTQCVESRGWTERPPRRDSNGSV